MHLNDIAKAAHNNSVAHGFWPEAPEFPVTLSIERLGLLLALIHSEVSEALEDARNGNMGSETMLVNSKPVGFPSELADIVIRVGDISHAMGYDLDYEVARKMDYNKTRPYKHGKAA